MSLTAYWRECGHGERAQHPRMIIESLTDTVTVVSIRKLLGLATSFNFSAWLRQAHLSVYNTISIMMTELRKGSNEFTIHPLPKSHLLAWLGSLRILGAERKILNASMHFGVLPTALEPHSRFPDTKVDVVRRLKVSDSETHNHHG